MSKRNSYQHTLTDNFASATSMVVAVPADALSAPTSDDLISAGATFLPTGAAWGTPDGEALSLQSVLARFVRVLLAPFEWLYARAWRLALESSVQTLGETLPDWEKEFGLPERCFSAEQSTSQRMMALSRKVNGAPLSHPEDFIRVAADFGFTIEIEEPCIFECGYSECAGRHEVGAAAEEAFIVVRVQGSSFSYFEVSTSECGFDPLFAAGGSEEIICFLRQELPGWVVVYPEEWRTYAHLVTEAGDHIVDQYGNRLTVRL
jgi:uncharacterized protein YmfQ (DUF2313 family)